MEEQTAHNTRGGLQGHAYPHRTSRREDAVLETRAGGQDLWVDIKSPEGEVYESAYLSEVQVDPPLGRAARKLTLPLGTVFETDDHAGIENLTGETHGSKLHHWEAFSPRLVGVVVACLAAVWVLWRYGLDIMAAAAIAMTPAPVIEQIDRGTLQTLDFRLTKETTLDEQQQAQARQIYRRLVSELPEDVQEKHSFDLLFRSMPGLGPNAFALPGGTMVMTDQFIKDFPDDDVIAGVLGHEIGHVVEQHGLKRLYRSLSAYVLIAFLAGDVGPFLEDIVLEGNVLLSLKFSRDQETDADEFGLSLAKKAGYEPQGLKQFFEVLAKKYGDREPPRWASTHPSNDDRLKAIDQFIDELR